MILTPKLNLKKPELTDYLSPSPFNDNSDILDDAMLAATYDPDGDGIVLEAIKATQDGNGDDISATYLPIEAGSLHPITGDLYIEQNGEGKGIHIVDGGVDTFRILKSSSNNSSITQYDTDGNVLTQIYMGASGTLRLGGMNTPIYIRPYGGVFDNTNQIVFNPNGQQTGGHPISEKSLSSSRSLAATTITNLLSFTGLDSSGVYYSWGQISFTPGSSTNGYVQMAFGQSASTMGLRTEVYSTGTGAKYLQVNGLQTGLTSIYLNAYVAMAGTVNSAYLRIVRIS